MIDRRVRYVGSSHLRKLNATALRGLGNTVYVIQGGNHEPISVLIGYEQLMKMQEMIVTAERLVGAVTETK